jgi:type I restriction enzyme M protein
LSERITRHALESYLWGAAVLLRGLIDAGDYKQFIFPLLFFKRVSDIWDEEYQAALADSDGDLSYAEFAENHRFQIPEGAHWNDVRQQPKNVGQAIQTALRQLEAAQPGPARRHLRRFPLDQPRAPARRDAQEPDRALLHPDAVGRQRA